MREAVRLYGFGSYFGPCPEGAGDVDFLVLHTTTGAASIRLALSCKSLLCGLISGAHVTMLSQDEERELRFMERCSPVYIGTLIEGAERQGARAMAERIGRPA